MLNPYIPTSLYVHVPWCIQKCPYCDFNSHTLKKTGDRQFQRYFDSLLRDLEIKAKKHHHPKIHSIFFGGGTPSLIPGKIMRSFMGSLKGTVSLNDKIEITLEANPGTADQAHFDDYRNAGINRLSIGAQSFSDVSLQTLGRIHTSSHTQSAMFAAQQSGFNNINLDMMIGLPKQTTEQALNEIQQALSLKPTHLSAYQLTIEPNTLFFKHLSLIHI